MLPLLPLVALIGLYFLSIQPGKPVNLQLTRAFILAFSWWGALVVAISEVLSWFSLFKTGPVAMTWLAIILASFYLAWRQGKLSRSSVPSLTFSKPYGIFWGIVILVCLSGIVAVYAVPNNFDALLYHLPRAVHWIQNGNINHYTTAYDHQLSFPPFAELIIAHIYMLAGNDLWVNLVQWAAMIGTLIALWDIGITLKLDQRAKWASLVFAISTPMLLLQSTSTQNDLVSTFVFLVFIAWCCRLICNSLSTIELFALTTSLGLAWYTKGSLMIYSVIPLAWIAWSQIRGARLIANKQGLFALVMPLLINISHWFRNWQSYHNILGPSSTIQGLLGFDGGITSWISEILRHALSHFATPWPRINGFLKYAMHSVDTVLGRSPNDFRLVWNWNHENFAGSPLHVTLIFLALVWLWWKYKKENRSIITGYAMVILTSGILFSILIRWNVYVVRLHLPVLAAMAPVVGLMISNLRYGRSFQLLSWGMLICALPYILFNRTRPLIGVENVTVIDSVVVEGEYEKLFANLPWLQDSYLEAVEAVQTAGCGRVALWIDSSDPEYPFWRLLGSPYSGVTLHSVLDDSPQASNSEYCAMICTVCGGRQHWNGLSQTWRQGDFSVFLQLSDP